MSDICLQSYFVIYFMLENSVADPDPDPYVFFGLLDPDPDPLERGVDPRSFYHQAKIVRKAMILNVL
jgi:hypothetical protein